MAGLTKTHVQLGDSITATQNFTLTSAAADGTMKLARGNSGSTTQDIITVDATGKVTFAQGIFGLTITQANQATLPGVGTVLSYTHGLGAIPASAELEVVCLTTEGNYSVGDVVTGAAIGNGTYAIPFNITKTSTVVQTVTGNATAWILSNKTTGAFFTPTSANWAWRFKVRVS